jgi:hypothetical protein
MSLIFLTWLKEKYSFQLKNCFFLLVKKKDKKKTKCCCSLYVVDDPKYRKQKLVNININFFYIMFLSRR